MYLLGNSSILFNILAWLGLWIAVSFAIGFTWIGLVEYNTWRRRRRIIKKDRAFFKEIEELQNDVG